MPTDPLQLILYRDLSIAEAAPFLEVASPLLRELVNYGTNALARCASVAGGKDEDIAVLALFRYAVELTDATEVLLTQSCAAPAQLQLRSLYETVWSIEYILELEDEYVDRSLAWLVSGVLKRRAAYNSFRLARSEQHSARRAFDEHRDPGVRAIQFRDPSPAIDNLDRFLAKAHIQPVVQRFESDKPRNWYQLANRSLGSLRDLARYLRLEAEYLMRYKPYSLVSHAESTSSFLARGPDGTAGIRRLREPDTIRDIAMATAELMLRAIRLVLGKWRPGEDWWRWYLQEVTDRYALLTGG